MLYYERELRPRLHASLDLKSWQLYCDPSDLKLVCITSRLPVVFKTVYIALER